MFVVHRVRRAAQGRSVGSGQLPDQHAAAITRKSPVLGPDQGHVRGGVPGVLHAAARHGRLDVGAEEPDSRVPCVTFENGRKIYQINCSPCHGPAGKGDGPVGKCGRCRPTEVLLTAEAKGLSDGYIWGQIRNGRGTMPSYNRIEEMERWDVVNYVRGLQAGTAPTGPVGYPGETGASLPRPTIDAPTRPAPYTPAWMDSARMIRPSAASASAPAVEATRASPSTKETR